MKTLVVEMECLAAYTSEIEVPDELSLEEAIEYAKNNNEYINVKDLEWVEDTELCEDCCHFE